MTDLDDHVDLDDRDDDEEQDEREEHVLQATRSSEHVTAGAGARGQCGGPPRRGGG
jgi:hypothetical protein